MAAFCIGHIRVKDAKAWEQYRSRVGATISHYGGEVLFRGQKQRTFCGDMAHERVVALKFANLEAANRWHESSDYQALIPIREQGADVTLVLYES